MSTSYHAGDWVEVRSEAEILATLDARGCLDGMPFMPEMLSFCGQRFRVSKRAHKTCDTVHETGGRRVPDCVHLENLRCDGSAHDGCQAACLLFWKTAWVKPVEGPAPETPKHAATQPNDGLSLEALYAATRKPSTPGEDPTYVCQTTALPAATQPLPWWTLSQYVEDYRSGNVSLWRLIRDPFYFVYLKAASRRIPVLGAALRWFNNRFRGLFGGIPYPNAVGTVPEGERTPEATLDLQPGEWVRIRPYDEILATLNASNKNRGMFFDKEEVPYCGGVYRVRHRVERFINEQTGAMMEMKTPSVILEGVTCAARYSENRLFCPRAIYPMWREIWLERAEPPVSEIDELPVLDYAPTQASSASLSEAR